MGGRCVTAPEPRRVKNRRSTWRSSARAELGRTIRSTRDRPPASPTGHMTLSQPSLSGRSPNSDRSASRSTSRPGPAAHSCAARSQGRSRCQQAVARIHATDRSTSTPPSMPAGRGRDRTGRPDRGLPGSTVRPGRPPQPRLRCRRHGSRAPRGSRDASCRSSGRTASRRSQPASRQRAGGPWRC